MKARSSDLEGVWECIHLECGYAVERQVHVPEWDRWKVRCDACGTGSTAWDLPAGPCGTCGAVLSTAREEAVLDLEVRSATVPRLFFDVTVRHSAPSGAQLLTAAAGRDGAVNHDAEGEKRRRYPEGRTPWRAVPLALETCGRHGAAALKHLRSLAKRRAERLDEGGDWASSELVLRRAAALASPCSAATRGGCAAPWATSAAAATWLRNWRAEAGLCALTMVVWPLCMCCCVSELDLARSTSF